MASSLKHTVEQYGTEHELQRMGVWELDPTDASKYWIIYLHGGAWRDPRIAHASFGASIDALLASPWRPRIAGFASLDYRLSAHPGFPQERRATVPAFRYRGAVHPAHLADARRGLARLQARYRFGARAVLVGHSCGAALAFQVVGRLLPDAGPLPVPPAALVGVEGLYDFAGIDARVGGAYAEFLSGAFGGPDPALWQAAAPVALPGSYAETWRLPDDDDDAEEQGMTRRRRRKPVVVLGWSPEDTLIDEPEIDAMLARLEKDGLAAQTTVLKDLQGDHNAPWEGGADVARLVGVALEKIDQGSEEGK
ncbi:alpha/beta-hydrolase [Xylariomycetidae sp. FL0641]|nr:alpha/beta-hydrolase [Xylariomycetidae sp. FL0641]